MTYEEMMDQVAQLKEQMESLQKAAEEQKRVEEEQKNLKRDAEIETAREDLIAAFLNYTEATSNEEFTEEEATAIEEFLRKSLITTEKKLDFFAKAKTKTSPKTDDDILRAFVKNLF